jgi:hypothetical protein
MLSIAIPAIAWSFSFHIARASASDSRVIVLDPPTLIGEDLPIIQYLSPVDAARLGHGRWTVLLVDGDCHKCSEYLRQLRGAGEGTTQSLKADDSFKKCIIDISTRKDVQELTLPAMDWTRAVLQSDIRVVVEVPIELTVNAGKIEQFRRVLRD